MLLTNVVIRLFLNNLLFLDDIRLFHEIPQRDCRVAIFSHGGHLLAAAIKVKDDFLKSSLLEPEP
jgi:hypothetical protein